MSILKEASRQTSKRRHPKSVFVQMRTGLVEPYPTGPYEKLNDETAQKLKQMGCYEAVILVETATGHRLPICIEEGVNNGTDHIRKLSKRRDDGLTPMYVYEADWDKLSAAERDAMLVTKSVAVSREASLEAEVAALRAKLAEGENRKAAR